MGQPQPCCISPFPPPWGGSPPLQFGQPLTSCSSTAASGPHGWGGWGQGGGCLAGSAAWQHWRCSLAAWSLPLCSCCPTSPASHTTFRQAAFCCLLWPLQQRCTAAQPRPRGASAAAPTVNCSCASQGCAQPPGFSTAVAPRQQRLQPLELAVPRKHPSRQRQRPSAPTPHPTRQPWSPIMGTTVWGREAMGATAPTHLATRRI